MADRVLRTVLTGRDELTSVLTKAAASTRAFEHTVEDANVKAAKSSTAAAQAYKAAAAGVVSATKQAHTAVAGMGDDFEREGTRAGGLLAQGVRSGIMRNSPLIVAALAGAMTAGAPLLLAGATTLFGVLGVVAAAQAEKVQSAWVGAWQMIRDHTIAAAGPIEDVLVGVADRVSAWSIKIGPQLAVGFREAAPLIDDFADSVMNAADNALPGLLRAVYRADPVIGGLGDLMESFGTGLSDMFDAMSEHSEAAGRAFSGLGGTFEVLLPLLGEFLGQGAELAADVLPALNGSLGLILATTQALGPALPYIITGLSAMKVGKSVAGGLTGLAESLGRVASNGGAFSGIAGGLSKGLSGIAASAGAAGAGIGLAAAGIYAWTEAGRQMEEISLSLGRAMEVGGAQAAAAADALQQWNDSAIGGFANGLPDAITSIEFFGTSIADLIPDAEQAKVAYENWYDSLDAGGRAAEDVAIAHDALSQAVEDNGPASAEAARAADQLAAAQAEVARIAAEEELAIRGVTDAMLAQTDAVLSAANSEYAHRVAIDAAHDSFMAMNDAVAEHGAWSEEAADAALDFEGSLLRVVAAAGTMAEDALPATMDANEKLALSQLAQLDQLRALEEQYGDALPVSLREMIAELERSTAGYDRARLEADALAEGTKGAQSAMEGLAAMNASPTIDADDKGIRQKTDGALAGLRNIAAQHPTPPLDADGGPVGKKLGDALAGLRNFAAQRPTPLLNADDKMLKVKQAGAMAGLSLLARQRPTPVLNADDGPIRGKVVNSRSALDGLNRMRPNPVLSATDKASGVISGVQGALAGLRDKTITITTINKTNFADGGPIRAATGVKIAGAGGPRDDLVRAYVPGGQEYRVSPGEWIVNAAASAMQGDARMRALNAGHASIVPHQGAATAMPGYNPSASWGGSAMQVIERNPQLTYVDQRPSGGDTMPKLAAAWREMEFLSGG